MQPEAPALLWHARRAAGLTLDFVSERTFEEYEQDPMLKSVTRAVPHEFRRRRASRFVSLR
jgi:hypothetical protein